MQNRPSSGFSLLEVLISLVILSIGLLGLAAFQAKSLTFHHESKLRAVAIAQASDMIDRMHTNAAGLQAGNYNSLSGIPNAPTCSNCTAQEVALWDLREWNVTNSQKLPNGQGTVVGNNGVFTITIRWDQNRTGATGLDCSGNLTDNLACFVVNMTLD